MKGNLIISRKIDKTIKEYKTMQKNVIETDLAGKIAVVTGPGGLQFLLNDQAAGFITGEVLPIDGGFSAYGGV